MRTLAIISYIMGHILIYVLQSSDFTEALMQSFASGMFTLISYYLVYRYYNLRSIYGLPTLIKASAIVSSAGYFVLLFSSLIDTGLDGLGYYFIAEFLFITAFILLAVKLLRKKAA